MERAAISRQLGHINVLDEGVLNDGTGDQSAALNAAFVKAAAASKAVHFPTGTYRILSTVLVRAPITASAEGGHINFGARIVNGDSGVANGIQNGTAMFKINAIELTTVNNNFSMQGLCFDGMYKNCIGFQGTGDVRGSPFHATTRHRIRDCYFYKCYIGIQLYGWIAYLDNLYTYGCHVTGMRLYMLNGSIISGGEFVNAPLENPGNYFGLGANTWAVNSWGIQLWASEYAQGSNVLFPDPVHGVLIQGCVLESNGRCNGLQISEGVKAVVLSSIYTEGFEGNDNTGTINPAETYWALQVGRVRGDGTARTTQVTSSNAVTGLTILGGTWNSGTSAHKPRVSYMEFDNVFGLHLVGSPAQGGGTVLYTNNCKNVNGSWGGTWIQGYGGTSATDPSPLPGAGGGAWDHHYGRDGEIVDRSGNVGQPAYNYNANPTFEGLFAKRGIRGFDVTGSILLASPLGVTAPGGVKSLRVQAGGADGASNNYRYVRIFWWGLPGPGDAAVTTWAGKFIVTSGWVYIPNSQQYGTGTQWPAIGVTYEDSQDNSTWTVRVGITHFGWNDGGTAHQFCRPGEWHQFHAWVEIPSTTYGIKNVALIVYPTANHGVDALLLQSIHMTHVAFCIASSVDDVAAGRYLPAPGGARMSPGGQLTIFGTAPPSDGNISWSLGDKVINTSPSVANDIDSWTCTTSGAGDVAVWTPNHFATGGGGGGASGVTLGSNQIYMGSLSTTQSGTWLAGDRVLNSTPTAGGNEGWICITSGTPGTWVPFGYIGSL